MASRFRLQSKKTLATDLRKSFPEKKYIRKAEDTKKCHEKEREERQGEREGGREGALVKLVIRKIDPPCV